MNQLSSRTYKQFKSLIDVVTAQHVEAFNLSALGPSVGDDTTPQPAFALLGPCVGDDVLTPIVTVLGPCVGDDAGPPSDIRLKEDVRCVGTTVFGLPLYHFRYIDESETYEGVMAQEVLKVMPGAVSVGADGFYRVNYTALGTSMRQVS
jgi:Chaperone of endosialidase